MVALKCYYASKKRATLSNSKNVSSKKVANKPSKLTKSISVSSDAVRPSSASSHHRANSAKIKPTERSILFETAVNEQEINLPAEELLELGLNYLNQAIKSWETALDSIESAAYMQSQTLALPTDEHADLVFKLRSLLDRANEISLNNTVKLIKSSKALQIIQSRLAYKQQLYAEALLKNISKSNETINEEQATATSMSTADNPQNEASSSLVPNSNANKYGYETDDNESFVSADSEFDWIDEDMFQRIENLDDKNALYEMAFSNANLGRVGYRVSRCEMFGCRSEADFAAKLHVLRLGFDRFLQDEAQRVWLIEQGRRLIGALLSRAEKDSTSMYKAYDEMIKYCTSDTNWRLIKDELATRDVECINFYDICLDFILLDAFEDLENPPSAIVAVIQNRWLSQSFKETALSTAVWSILKAKRKLLKYPNGFISRFYTLNEYLVPILAWGFLGTDSQLNESCLFMKTHILEYLKCLFDMNKTRYTNLEELHSDIQAHTSKYLEEILDRV